MILPGCPATPGFPAPAGMDPTQVNLRRTAMRIPRTRGDGPDTDYDISIRAVDSPHPRGWTRGRVSVPGVRRGFPAPAGMDP